MRKRIALVFVALLWLFCQCENHSDENDNGRDYPTMETFKIIDDCMSYMNSNPQKAHQMLDSLAEAKLMTKQRCDYYHAIVLFSGENQLDSALLICNQLLDERKFGDDNYLEEEICVLASNISTSCMRHLETLKYAKRGIAICHGNEKMRGDEAALMAQVGVAEQGLGRIKQARKTFARAYKLLDINSSFGDFVALISLQKKQIGLYKESCRYDSIITICHKILDEVEGFDRDPSFIEQRPESMKESSPATHDFADFYRCQMYCHIAQAYRLIIQKGLSTNIQADTDSAKAYIDRWSSTKGAQSPSNLASALPELHFLGKKAEFAQAKAKVEEQYRGDSLVSEYVEFLVLVAEDAASNHDFKTSNQYLKRAIVISDSLRKQDLLRSLSEQMSLNMVQEHQLAQQDAEYQVSRQRIVIILLSAVLVIMLAAGVIIVILVRKNRKSEYIIESTQQDLTESKEEIKELAQQLEETRAEKAANNTKALYERIEKVMREDELYLNPDLDIKMLAEMVFSSRSIVSACINSVTGKSFRQWISEYRLSLFVEMLKKNPSASLDVLMMRCGYKDQSTFRRQFKATYGMTAGEYRKKLSESPQTPPNLPLGRKISAT